MKKFTIVVETEADIVTVVRELDGLVVNLTDSLKLKSILEVQE